MAEPRKTAAKKAPAKAAAKKAPAKRAPAKKASARKVATTGFEWACQCGKTRQPGTEGMTVAGRCPECNTPLTLQEQ